MALSSDAGTKDIMHGSTRSSLCSERVCKARHGDDSIAVDQTPTMVSFSQYKYVNQIHRSPQ